MGAKTPCSLRLHYRQITKYTAGTSYLFIFSLQESHSSLQASLAAKEQEAADASAKLAALEVSSVGPLAFPNFLFLCFPLHSQA